MRKKRLLLIAVKVIKFNEIISRIMYNIRIIHIYIYTDRSEE